MLTNTDATTKGTYETNGRYLVGRATTGGKWTLSRVYTGASGATILMPINHFAAEKEAWAAAVEDALAPSEHIVRDTRAEMCLQLLDAAGVTPEWNAH